MVAKKTKPKPASLKTGYRRKPFNPNPPPPPKAYQFKPGQSGNPGGRPKLLSGAYKKMLATVNERDGRTNAELIAEAAKVESLKGDIPAMRELRQATEGDLLRFEKMTDDDILKYLTTGDADASATPGGGGGEAPGPGIAPAVPGAPGGSGEAEDPGA